MTGWSEKAGDSIAAQAELARHPFQGPDKLPRAIKIGGTTSHTIGGPIKQWKPSAKPTDASTAHVDMSQLAFREKGVDVVYRFWALAPVKAGYRRMGEGKSRDFVWLTCPGKPGTIVHALADKVTGEIYWRDNSRPAGHPMPGTNHPAALLTRNVRFA